MWNSAPAGGGTVLTWPPAVDDILVANNQTIRVNVSVSVAQYRNGTTGGATAGGFFQCNTSGVSITGIGYNDAGNANGIFRSILASGTLFFVGGMTGGSLANSYILYVATGTTTINVTGNVAGGTGVQSFGIALTGAFTGTVNLTGDAISGAAISNGNAVNNNSGGNVTVTGNSIASGSVGMANGQSGTVTVSGYAQASDTQAAISNVAQGILQVGETRSAANGRGAVVGAFRYASATTAKTMPYTPEGQISMTVLDVAAIVPAESDVRKTVVYGDGAYTGTLPLGRSRTSMAGRF
jgi:hypothetical protein